MQQDIYIIDDKTELINKMQEIFKCEKKYHFYSVKSDEMEIALKDIPTLIIVEDDNTKLNAVEICNNIRKDEDNSITPVIVISSNSDHDYRTEILNMFVQGYILKPIDDQFFYYTVRNVIDFAEINRGISPLTGLPGNMQIQAEMKRRLLRRKQFAVVYFDMDNFKAYNDVYGFSNGDEIIKLQARIIVKYIHELEGYNFVGHIGGDDFVAIIDKTDYDKLCKNVINEFDKRVLAFYSKEDLERGYVEVANRRGIIEKFPVVSISIAVVEINKGSYKNPLEIGEVSAQIKHRAKEILGSSYVINRRRIRYIESEAVTEGEVGAEA